jgi:predicted ABC-type ATPase
VAERFPVFHLLAGPNGAGKTSFYNFWIKRRVTDAEFVNADLLSFAALGRHAVSREDAQVGQRLAEARRDELMALGRSLVAETTFSHPSKLDLVRKAKDLGYEVVVYHLNLGSADEAVARVTAREAHGGHPVPEANIRGRYERNQALIREAVLMSDRAFIFDNSAFGRSPKMLAAFVNGRATEVAEDLPAWAATLYGPDVKAAE